MTITYALIQMVDTRRMVATLVQVLKYRYSVVGPNTDQKPGFPTGRWYNVGFS